MKCHSREIDSLNYCIALKFDWHLGSSAAEVPVKFQSDSTSLNTNLVTLRLCEILEEDVLSDIETRPQIEVPAMTDTVVWLIETTTYSVTSAKLKAAVMIALVAEIRISGLFHWKKGTQTIILQ